MKQLQNMGGPDRLARLVAGIALLLTGLFTASGAGWHVAAFAVGAVLVVTAISGICPGYWPFGLDTRRRSPHAS